MSRRRATTGSSPDELRRRAESEHRANPPRTVAGSSPDARQLVHELRVHQVELEIQNEELRTAQLQLSAARDRYMDLYEFAPVGYLTVDARHIVLDCNLRSAILLNVEREELPGRRLDGLVAPDDRDACYLLLRAAAGPALRSSGELQVLHSDGGRGWLLAECVWHSPGSDGEGEFRVILHDITARKQAEATLRESEERFRTMANGLPLIVWVHDADGRQQFVNRTFHDFFGVTEEEVRAERWRSLLHPEDADGYIFRFLECVKQRVPFHGEARVLAADGQWHWIESWGRPRFLPTGEFAGFVGTSADVTGRVRAEEALVRLNESLEEKVAERTSMLRLQHDIAAAANRAQNLDEALQFALRCVVEHNGWCLGNAYLLEDGDSPVLVPARTSYAAGGDRFAALRAALRSRRLAPGEGLPGRTVQSRTVRWTDDLEGELRTRQVSGDANGICCGAAFPILAGDEAVGVLEFFSEKPMDRTHRLLESMTTVGTQLGRVVERQRFERQLARALQAEQERLGQDLHDTVGQDLAGLALIADRLTRQAQNGHPPDAAALKAMSDGLRAALDDARAVVRGLLPPAVAHAEDFSSGLQELVEGISRRYQVQCAIERPTSVPMAGPEVAVHLYRIASEAVTNAAKHANADRITFYVAVQGDVLVLEVRDNGVGLPADAELRGSGLWIMRHRASVIGATLDVRPHAEGGTVVTCCVPAERWQTRLVVGG